MLRVVDLNYIFSKKYINTPFQINIYSDLEESNWRLSKSLLIKIFLKDEVIFQDRGMRIFDHSKNVFYKIGDDFSMSIDKSHQPNLLILLRTPDANIKKKRFDELEEKVKDMTKSINWMKAQLLFLNMNPSMSKQESQMIRETSSEHEEEKFDSFSELTFDINRPKSKTTQSGANQIEEISSNSRSHSSFTSVPNTMNRNISGLSNPPSLKKFYSMNIGRDEVSDAGSVFGLGKKSKLDIAILYSDPLVRKNNKNGSLIPLDDPVNFELECVQIKKMLESLDKEIHLTVEIATVSNLIKIVHREPTILHFICHGDYSKEQQKFFLAFENERAELDECDTRKLQKLFSKINSNQKSLQLVFVNACHSEEVGKVFSDAGVPAVIAVQSELKIEDKVALEFAEQFYRELFNGQKIKDSVEIARNNTQAIQDRNVFTCCCAHRHKANCKWYEEAMNSGYGNAHLNHIPTCSCEKAQQHIHKSNCTWGNQFLLTYAEEDEERFFLGTSEIFVCCCSFEVTHDESMKFLEIYNDDRQGSFPIFSTVKPDGELIDHTNWEIGNAKFSGIKIIGRNWQIHRLYELLTSKHTRLIQVSGEAGVGKTSFVQQTSNYLYERNHFRDNIVYINLEKVKSLATFLNRIKLDYLSVEKMCDFLNSKEVLFILDNCDMILEFHGEKFEEKITQIITNTKHVKFVICTQIIHKLKINGSQALTLSALEESDAYRLLLHLAGDQASMRAILGAESQVRELLQMVKRTPKSLWTLAETIREKKNLRAVLDELEKEDLADEGENNGFNEIKMTLKALEERNVDAHDFLLLLSEFPSGITSSDLQIMCEEQGLIATNWITHIQYLTFSNCPDLRGSGVTKQRSKTDGFSNYFGGVTNLGSLEEISPTIIANQVQVRKSKSPKASMNASKETTPLASPRNKEKSEDPIQEIKCGNYFWFIITPTNIGNSIVIKVHQYITNFLKEKYETFPEISFKSLAYIRCLSQIIITKMKEERTYAEKIVECSEASEEGLWETKDDTESSIQLVRSLSKQSYYNSFKVDKILSIHELNLTSILEADSIQDIFQNLAFEQKKKLVSILLTIFRNVPTIFKMLGRFSEAREIAETVTAICENPKIFSFHIKELSLVKVQIQLFLCALHLEEHFQIANSETWKEELESQIRIAEDVMNEDFDKIRKLAEHELNLIRIVKDIQSYSLAVNLRNRSKSESNYRQKLDKEASFRAIPNKEGIIRLISKMKESLRNDGWDKQYPTLYSKLTILDSEMKTAGKALENNVIKDLKTAISHFKRIGSEYLELRANKALALYVLHCESDILLKEAKSVFCERAIILAASLKDNGLEAECKELLDALNSEIRKLYSNLFVFMRSCPLVQMTKGVISPCSEFNFYNFNFRKEIAMQFGRKHKKVSLRLDIMTMEDFAKNIDFGCKTLFLSMLEWKEGEIVFEGKTKEAIRIPFSEFQERVLGDANRKITNVDILILAVPNSRILAEFFNSIGIQRIVYFEFFEKNSFMTYYFQEICMKEFSMQFLDEILEGYTILESFNHAQDHMIQKAIQLSSITEKGGFCTYVGMGGKLFPEDSSYHDVMPFESKIESGEFEDISSIKVVTNLPLQLEPFVGRNVQLYKALKALSMNEPVNVFGIHGSGRTAFAKVLADFCLSRSMFPHGIYYFPLKRLISSDLDLKDLMKEELGEIFAKRIQMYFDKKRMLIIFDDFDVLNSKRDIFADHIISSLEENRIPYVAITKRRIERKINFIELSVLSTEEASLLFQTWAMVGPGLINKEPWFEFPLKLGKETLALISRNDKLPRNLAKAVKESGVGRERIQDLNCFTDRKAKKKNSHKYDKHCVSPYISRHTSKFGKACKTDLEEEDKIDEDELPSLQLHSKSELEYNGESIDSKGHLSNTDTKSHGSDTMSRNSSTQSINKRLTGPEKEKGRRGKKGVKKHIGFMGKKTDKYFTHVQIIERKDSVEE